MSGMKGWVGSSQCKLELVTSLVGCGCLYHVVLYHYIITAFLFKVYSYFFSICEEWHINVISMALRKHLTLLSLGILCNEISHRYSLKAPQAKEYFQPKNPVSYYCHTSFVTSRVRLS